MDEAKANYAFAATLADQLAAGGVAGVCLSPGSRSAPLAMAFARHPGLRVYVHIDERSCAFFGLGLARATGRPAVLLCTSGTAAAEFHPAVVEAHHARVPLLVLTADRPPELIDVGANQAIDQGRLYGTATRWFHDPGTPILDATAGDRWRRLAARALAEAAGPPPGPVHLNLPLREPLVPPPGEEPPAVGATRKVVSVLHGAGTPTPAMVELVTETLAGAQRPVLLAGGMRDGARLREAARALGVPVLAEPASQIRFEPAPYDAILRDAEWASAHRPDAVLRIGAPMTSKAVNRWVMGARTVVVDEGGGWPDPELAAGELLRCDPLPLLRSLPGSEGSGWLSEWRAAARAAEAAVGEVLGRVPLFEAHVVRALAAELPPAASLLVGSSMPIRDVDTFWPAAPAGPAFFANRGASGIDGMVSTALGVAAAGAGQPAAMLLGDLGLYHDMNGLWAVRRHHLKPLVVVLDNGGGGIFSFLPHAAHVDVFEELFGTPLGLRLEDAARLYGLDCAVVDRAGDLRPALRQAVGAAAATMLIVRFRREDSVAGHRACWLAVAEALRRS